jgi:outer membrane lipoprotein-sorting protein
MRRLLIALILVAVAISGCTEKGPSVADKSAEELKNLSISSAGNLSSYSLKSSLTSTWKLHSGNDTATDKLSTFTDEIESIAAVDLQGLKVHANSSTKNMLEIPDQPANATTTNVDFYLIGNTTYVEDGNGNWTHLVDPRSAEEVWGPDRNNQVKALASTFNLSKTEMLGIEPVNGEDAYKLKIVPGNEDNISLFNTAFAIAAKVTQYPFYLPSLNRSELNETGKIEKTIWISKSTYLPVKYESAMSFTMTPEIVGALDPNTGKATMFNQSVQLGAIFVSTKATDLYYDFNKLLNITPPMQALSSPAITPQDLQEQVGEVGAQA